jgi:hypothetical protein
MFSPINNKVLCYLKVRVIITIVFALEALAIWKFNSIVLYSQGQSLLVI